MVALQFAQPAWGSPSLGPQGLALIPEIVKENAGLGLAAGMAMAAVAATPALVRRTGGIPMLAKVAAAAAVPATMYTMQPPAAHAIAAPAAAASDNADMVYAPLAPVYSMFYPLFLAKVLAKNIGLQCLVRVNKYMVETLEHERQALEAEQQGEEPPEAPPFPDMHPALMRGLFNFTREVLVGTVRRIYEHLAVARLGRGRAASLLRDSKAWIRTVLAPRLKGEPLAKRFVKYQFATLHATALFFAADCTVAIGFHTYRVAVRKDRDAKGKALLWAKGCGLQAVRCIVTMAAVSVGASVGALIKPGAGTFIGHAATEAIVGIGMTMVIESMMD